MGDENNTSTDENRKLQDIFLEAWNQYEFLDETTIDTNSAEYQNKVKDGIKNFELATKIVSQINMFSTNEFIDEVPTESLQYLLLPFFLGKLTLKCYKEERGEVLGKAEVYFKDFLQRCQNYELCDGPKMSNDEENSQQSGCIDTTQQLVASAVARNNKIAQFRRKKELEEQIKKMRVAVRCENVDDEIKRNFFLNFIQKSIIETNEELQDIKLEKGVVEMRKQRMAEFGTTRMDDILPPGSVIGPGVSAGMGPSGHSHNHGHGHSHHHHHGAAPKPKPMQPFIITKDAAQKAVFGMGYPSLPVMSVDEFYQQRVDEGVFPDEEKMARINAEKALAAAQDPEEKEEEEKAAMEEKIENDDPENLARMRRMDEYRDVVRRGDGNRHNRS
ncbi:immunoglobulin-binding protein 1 [Musca vetustissima]|uniref:immunoglobulin-binding protein 1 n=1 Tax=Musca vetustissima TaxID=27455 RepID=UPI002AB67CF1|nr:immunoglobulin-binding protein 1 [Musca vetustissima]